MPSAMPNLKVAQRTLAKNYTRGAERFLELLADARRKPAPETIHNMRVAARRNQASAALLPKKMRKSKRFREYRALQKSVLKSSRKLRDLDVLITTLKSRETLLPPRIVETLKSKRGKAALEVGAALASIANASPPVLDHSGDAYAKASKRLARRVSSRARRLRRLLKRVLGDERRADDLHSLRKESKKLRYLLELSSAPQPAVKLLEAWQESLGAIHDLDIAIAYLKPILGSRMASEEVRMSRHIAYIRFVKAYNPENAMQETVV